MNVEVELKVLEIDIKAIKEALKENWANRIWEKFFRRYVYDMNPKVDWKRLRLRTDWSKTTLACKQILNEKVIDWVNEREIVVDSFEECNELLNQMWFFHRAYQENKRESYELDWCKIEIDERPLIPPYLEIESDSEEKILSFENVQGSILDRFCS